MKQENKDTLFEFFKQHKETQKSIKVYLNFNKEDKQGKKNLMLSGIPIAWDDFCVRLEGQTAIIPYSILLNIIPNHEG